MVLCRLVYGVMGERFVSLVLLIASTPKTGSCFDLHVSYVGFLDFFDKGKRALCSAVPGS